MMEVPDLAIRWMARNASSNVELATLSSVNRHWRQVMVDVIIEVSEKNKDDKDAPLSSLLLPTMARGMQQESSCSSDVNSGTFCLAWFPPMGIQIMSVQLGEPISSEEDTDNNNNNYNGSCTDAFAPSGGPSYEGSEDDNLKKQIMPAFRTLAAASSRIDRRVVKVHESRRQTCSHEWRGYRLPLDVLHPFGYATDFVNCVLLSVSKRISAGMTEDELSGSLRRAHLAIKEKRANKEHRTTLAVRGATFARPDGYCLCWDVGDNCNEEAETDQELNGWELVRMQEYKRSRLMRTKRRRDLQQLVLPRMVLSTKDKQPPENTTFVNGRRQRSLQFLNAEGSHAVRIMTPPFACGPVQGPITVFCVAIATEDGCFFSGLKRRYEVGHMYPSDPRDALADMSPICLVTDRPSAATASSPKARLENFSRANSLDSDDSSCDSHNGMRQTMGEFGIKCECPIADTHMGSSLSNYVNDDDDTGEPRDEDIYRGRIGPGLWHCYVAVFDGEDSMIRIDGRSEPLAPGSRQKDSDSQEDRSSSSSHSRQESSLDGLTIGADHCFDMSLCYGDGVNGEGEGAISELAAFKGRMSIPDIEMMEGYLMEKHGIPKPLAKPTTPEKEDEWRRQAHALIVQPPPWKLDGKPVPLRVIAKHKSVAWHRTNGVTGKVLPVPRIGSKHSTGSSDW